MVSNLLILSLIIIMNFLVLSVQGQCADCSAEWKTKCKTGGVRDWVCNATSEKQTFDPSQTTVAPTIYEKCTPYGWEIMNVGGFCCIYSEETGCQIAVSNAIYTFTQNVVSLCKLCYEHCKCDTDGSWMFVPITGLYWLSVCLYLIFC